MKSKKQHDKIDDNEPATRNWKEYQRMRRALGITMLVPDEVFKERLQAAARSENRSVNNFLQHHILPLIMRELDLRERMTPQRVPSSQSR